MQNFGNFRIRILFYCAKLDMPQAYKTRLKSAAGALGGVVV
jgi:hypothetical protein